MILLQNSNLENFWFKTEEEARNHINTLLASPAPQGHTLEQVVELLSSLNEHKWAVSKVPLPKNLWVVAYEQVQNGTADIQYYTSWEEALADANRRYQKAGGGEVETLENLDEAVKVEWVQDDYSDQAMLWDVIPLSIFLTK